ncbi:hypothetical protein K4K56_004830 [Colletotrichum sp. SAR 10_98]|nr:hypothetical protein K4K56_004830 [Colletotrichum sp. SAR 10_98]
MALTLLPYSPKYYDTLPGVVEAGRNAEPSGAIEALTSDIGQVFIKYGMENTFGIILLHNHFEISASEMLVQFGNAAVPWDTKLTSADVKNIVPTAWRFVEAGLAPWEFTYSSPHGHEDVPELTNSIHGPFLLELKSTLSRLGLEDVLGLVVLGDDNVNGPPRIEIESGRSTITLDVDVNPREDDGFIHVIWQFGTDGSASGPQPVVFKKYKVAYKLSIVPAPTRDDPYRSEQVHDNIHQTTRK